MSLFRRSTESSWFALRVKARRERAVCTALSAKGYDTYLPQYLSRRQYGTRFKNLQLPLFEGYLFCRFDPSERLPILKTESVLDILSDGRTPAAIPEVEITTLQSVVASKLAVEPHPFLAAGDRVRIAEGPLRDIEGILREIKDRQRLVVSVHLLQRAVSVEIDRGWVRPIHS